MDLFNWQPILSDLSKKLFIPREIPAFLMKAALETIYNVEVTGTENVPLNGGAILVCNHTDSLDIPVTGLYLPRKVVFLAKSELFYPQEEIVKAINSPMLPLASLPPLQSARKIIEDILNALGERHKEQLEQWGGVPIVRSFHGEGAKAAVEYYERVEQQMIDILKSGEILAIFPEGTRTSTGMMAPFKALAAKIAIRANVPVIPSGINGAWKMSTPEAFLSGKAFRAKITYNIGNIVPPDQFPTTNEKKSAKLLTEELEKRVHYLIHHQEKRKKSRRFANVL